MSRRRRRYRKLTSARTNKIVTAIRAGNTIRTSAEWADISYVTVYRWYADGALEDAPQELKEFRRAVDEARSAAEFRMVAAVVKDATGGALVKRVTRELRDGTVETEEQFTPPNGRVALEWLARARPQQWSRHGTVEVEVSGPNGGPIAVDHQAGSAEQIAERLRVFLAERNAAGGDRDGPDGDEDDGGAGQPGSRVIAGEVVNDP